MVLPMLEVAQRKLKPSVGILYRTDRGIFNLRQLQAKSRTHQTAVVEFQRVVSEVTLNRVEFIACTLIPVNCGKLTGINVEAINSILLSVTSDTTL